MTNQIILNDIIPDDHCMILFDPISGGKFFMNENEMHKLQSLLDNIYDQSGEKVYNLSDAIGAVIKNSLLNVNEWTFTGTIDTDFNSDFDFLTGGGTKNGHFTIYTTDISDDKNKDEDQDDDDEDEDESWYDDDEDDDEDDEDDECDNLFPEHFRKRAARWVENCKELSNKKHDCDVKKDGDSLPNWYKNLNERIIDQHLKNMFKPDDETELEEYTFEDKIGVTMSIDETKGLHFDICNLESAEDACKVLNKMFSFCNDIFKNSK